ncbi:hypothetical protein AB0J90_18080 [Micromonospora sp. NPDC049523]|uniref:hypothetical protein n=1 Tax=Micromonospora sp. NPDC049523 TaxID=3155921 RepID=UPI003425867E
MESVGRMRRRWTLVLLTLASVFAVTFAVTGPAGAVPPPDPDVNLAQRATPGSEAKVCRSTPTSSIQGCFQKYGDRWWINLSPGWDQGTIEWSNELWGPNGWEEYRDGTCISQSSGWAACNKDYYEDSTVRTGGYSGSRLTFRVCAGVCVTVSPTYFLNDA